MPDQPGIVVLNMDEVRRNLRVEELVLPAVQDLLEDAALIGEATARDEAPKDTSTLARDITSEVKPMMARVYTPLQYALTQEEGRRAGARMPPPGALLEWMRRRGIPANMEFPLARAIARRGTKGRFFMRAAGQKVQESFPSLINKALQRIQQRWQT